ncbi:MAG: SDR family NAD(P)-dependent oxidoreductase, partial [Deltaproteobacteria bacterium]|nr:SDR family NAD(P)-dependent oxidoreductase [Deltaproteobacteria bacterium]
MSDGERVVVITGGSMGIGRATAVRFAEENPLIHIIHYDREDGPSQSTLQMLTQKGVKAESHKV